jgi:aldehyde:ferredoxin oxidoreductase
LSRDLQVATAAIDSFGMCLFCSFAFMDQSETYQALLDLISGFNGASMTAEDVAELGKSVLRNERDFNMRAGMTNKDDRLPDFFSTERLAPHNITFEVSDEELDQVHNY